MGVLACGASDKQRITFCVPASALREELATAQRLTAEQRSDVASGHLQRVVFNRYALATKCVLDACELWLAARITGEEASVEAKRQALLQVADYCTRGLDKGLSTVVADAKMPGELKQRLLQFAVLHNRARLAMLATDESCLEFAHRCGGLRGEFARQGGALIQQLGIETP